MRCACCLTCLSGIAAFLTNTSYLHCRPCTQAEQLPAATCLKLLSALETGASGHIEIQRVADTLLTASSQRLYTLLGPLQDMLNDDRRREVFGKLPFELLRVRQLQWLCHWHHDAC